MCCSPRYDVVVDNSDAVFMNLVIDQKYICQSLTLKHGILLRVNINTILVYGDLELSSSQMFCDASPDLGPKVGKSGHF